MADVFSAPSLPWIWVIESLASNKDVDVSLLNGLIAHASRISDDLGKNARERVALRCLEDLFDRSQGDSDCRSSSHSKAKFDVSETCENVLHRIASEVSSFDPKMTTLEKSKWDVGPFIMHKKASLPKCALELLKNELIRGSHPSAYFLRGRSGLIFDDQNNHINGADDMERDLLSPTSDMYAVNHHNIIKAGRNQENVNGVLPEDSLSKIVLSTKTNMRDTTVGQNLEEIQRSDRDFNPKTKKHKSGSSYTNSRVDQESVPIRSNPQFEITHGKTTIDTEQCNIREECGLQGLERIRCAEYVLHDDSDNEAQHNQLPPGNDKIPQGASNGHHKAKSVNEASAYMENGVIRTKRKILTDEAEDDSEDEIANNNGDYNMDKLELAATTLMFLSSQCTSDDDPLTTDNLSEQNLCMKCNKDGQVLRCFATDCPVTIHENCLGSTFNFYDDGNFYCPFCTYSRSISKYLEAKKTASHARKTLADFISFGPQKTDIARFLPNEMKTKLRPRRGVGPVIHNPKKKKAGQTSQRNNRRLPDDQQDNYQTMETGENGNQNISQQKRGVEVEQPEGSVEHIAPRREERETILNRTPNRNITPTMETRTLGTGENGNQNITQQKRGVDVEQPEESVEHIAPQREERETILNSTPNRNVGKNQVAVQRQMKKSSADPNTNPDPDSSSHTDKETIVLNRNVGTRRAALRQRVSNTPTRSAHEPESDEEAASEDIDSNYSSDYFISFRSPSKSNPMSRRKQIKWTAEEEETLKEGMQRYAPDEVKKVPWKQIMEFGSTVFEKTRTTVDLKDKWRNMCKGSPKGKTPSSKVLSPTTPAPAVFNQQVRE